MMQKRSSRRISAQPNTKAYGGLSIAVHYDGQGSFLYHSGSVFVPAPNGFGNFKMVQGAMAVEVQDANFSLSRLALSTGGKLSE